MARPPLDPGTYGKITITPLRSGGFEARCKYRSLNGVIVRPSACGPSRAAAERALKKKLTELASSTPQGAVTRETRFRAVAEMWLDDIAYQAKNGSMSHNSHRTYQSCLKGNVLPRVGALQLREITVAVCDQLIKDTRESMGYESAKKVRTIVSAVLSLAIQRGALDVNPVKSTSRLTQGHADRKTVKAMTPDQVVAMLAGLRDYAATKELDSMKRRQGWRVLVWHDLPELAEADLATGVRPGELLALSGEDIGRDDSGGITVTINTHLVRVNGQGLVRIPGRKNNRPAVTLGVPEWAAPMFARRKLAAGTGPLFAARDGGWLDPSNTAARFREALDAAGLDWVTPKVWRATVATHLDEMGLTAAEIADQLGNTPAVVERHYRRKRARNPKATAALETIKGA